MLVMIGRLNRHPLAPGNRALQAVRQGVGATPNAASGNDLDSHAD
jgi:hypothetical protein